MRIQFLIFFTIILSLMYGVHYYFYKKTVNAFTALSPKKVKWSFMVLATLVILSLVLGRVVPFSIGKYLFLLPMIWMGIMVYPVLILLGGDLVLFLQKKLAKEDEVDESKRQFLRKSAVGLAGGSALVGATVGAAEVLQSPSIYKIPLKFSTLPKEFDGLKVVQISDVHIGRMQTGEWLADVVKQINELKPDLVAITGDLVDGPVDFLAEDVKPLVNLKSTYGSFFITGNHEYYAGADQWIHFLETLGIRVLRNESVSLKKGESQIHILGVDDYRSKGIAPGHGPDLDKAYGDLDLESFKILLAHQPNEIKNVVKKKGIDLQLSGHTHGGQIWPFTYISKWVHSYNIGLYSVNDRTKIYVNQGTGAWGPPVRVGTECEITEFIIKQKRPS